ncbi:MAG TPA: energy-coupling factor ABC transporter permease [Planctomycetota bacterium]|jgi:cobalt/nickel transport system permease protein
MHLRDVLSPEVNIATAAMATGACAIALVRARRSLDEKQVPLLGVTAAFIFAAQMVNFPIGPGVSGHFLGALMASVLLGPFNACLIMAVVLAIQCLLFQDGGLTALGANLFNMGVIGGICSYGCFRGVYLLLPKTRNSFMWAAAAASWFSVVAASLACAAELALSGILPWKAALVGLGGVHGVIGIGEAIITTAVLSTVLGVRPDLVGAWRPASNNLEVA